MQEISRKEVLVETLKQAGAEMMRFDPSLVAVSEKSTSGDLVTAADLASEKAIVECIMSYFPEDIVITEEASDNHNLLNPEKLTSLTAWVIDPLDGTNNFKHNMAYSGISIGYIEHGEIVLGGIYNPFRDELYVAEKGNGAYLNGKRLSIGERTLFDSGTRVCTSNSYEGGTRKSLHMYDALGHVWVDVLSSAVLIMCDVASGRLDLYFHNGLKPWDNAAGFLIAGEAGAKIVGFDGAHVSWLSPDVVMGNQTLVDEFIRLTTAKLLQTICL